MFTLPAMPFLLLLTYADCLFDRICSVPFVLVWTLTDCRGGAVNHKTVRPFVLGLHVHPTTPAPSNQIMCPCPLV